MSPQHITTKLFPPYIRRNFQTLFDVIRQYPDRVALMEVKHKETGEVRYAIVSIDDDPSSDFTSFGPFALMMTDEEVANYAPQVQYEVIVGNVGTVYSGTDIEEATKTYWHYVKEQPGRAAGEEVTFMADGEPSKPPKLDQVDEVDPPKGVTSVSEFGMGKSEDEQEMPPFDEVSEIMAYEEGELSDERTKRLFQRLVDNGHAWTLQGSYGRTAEALLEAGVIKRPSAKQEAERNEQEGRIPVGGGCAYEMIRRKQGITFHTPRGDRHFTVAIYGAYNAMGLVGSEHNGVVVLDEDQKRVLADELAIATSGYYGETDEQERLFDQLVSADWPTFVSLIDDSGRNRYRLADE